MVPQNNAPSSPEGGPIPPYPDLHNPNSIPIPPPRPVKPSPLSHYPPALLLNTLDFTLHPPLQTRGRAHRRLPVVTTDAYTYISVIAEILNEGLPRAASNVIGDASSRSFPQRLVLTDTLIMVRSRWGLR